MAKVTYIIAEPLDSFGSFENLTVALRRLQELGYAGVELNLLRPAEFDAERLARFVESIHLPVVSFLSGANYFSDGLCLSSPRAEVRERAVECLEDCVKVAARFGALLVIGQMRGFLSDEPDRAVAEARIEECLKQVAETAERHSTTLVLEPVNHLQVGFHTSLSEVMALAASIGSARLKPMLDTIHMNIEEKSMTEPIFRAGRDLAHFHLCESNGNLLGSGHLNFKEIGGALDAIGYAGYVSVKVYRQPWTVGAEASIRYLAELDFPGARFQAAQHGGG